MNLTALLKSFCQLVSISKLLLLFCFSCSHAKILEIYDVEHQKSYRPQEFIKLTNADDIQILGEFHHDYNIQKAQAQLINQFVIFHKLQHSFTVHWEFLNFNERAKTENEFKKLQDKKISFLEFLENTAGKQNHHYASIVERLVQLKGHINGVNLPRAMKQKMIKEGIEALDPKFIPPYHYVGDDNYFTRFKRAMGEHVEEHMISKYFEAQCLTDSTMAYHLSEELSLSKGHFLIAGSFHTDYFGGTVARLKKLTSRNITLYKFISKSKTGDEELKKYQQTDLDFGNVADYLIITK